MPLAKLTFVVLILYFFLIPYKTKGSNLEVLSRQENGTWAFGTLNQGILIHFDENGNPSGAAVLPSETGDSYCLAKDDTLIQCTSKSRRDDRGHTENLIQVFRLTRHETEETLFKTIVASAVHRSAKILEIEPAPQTNNFYVLSNDFSDRFGNRQDYGCNLLEKLEIKDSSIRVVLRRESSSDHCNRMFESGDTGTNGIAFIHELDELAFWGFDGTPCFLRDDGTTVRAIEVDNRFARVFGGGLAAPLIGSVSRLRDNDDRHSARWQFAIWNANEERSLAFGPETFMSKDGSNGSEICYGLFASPTVCITYNRFEIVLWSGDQFSRKNRLELPRREQEIEIALITSLDSDSIAVISESNGSFQWCQLELVQSNNDQESTNPNTWVPLSTLTVLDR